MDLQNKRSSARTAISSTSSAFANVYPASVGTALVPRGTRISLRPKNPQRHHANSTKPATHGVRSGDQEETRSASLYFLHLNSVYSVYIRLIEWCTTKGRALNKRCRCRLQCVLRLAQLALTFSLLSSPFLCFPPTNVYQPHGWRNPPTLRKVFTKMTLRTPCVTYLPPQGAANP